jgi:hypothetical protein
MTRTPRGQCFAIVLPRFLIEIEDARVTTIAAAVAHIGFDGRSRRWIVAQDGVAGRRHVGGHGSNLARRNHDGGVVGGLQAAIMRKGTLRRALMLRRSRTHPTERR